MRFVLGLIAGVAVVLIVAAMLPPAASEVMPADAQISAAELATFAATVAVLETEPARSVAAVRVDPAADLPSVPASVPMAGGLAPDGMGFEAAASIDDAGLILGGGGEEPGAAAAGSGSVSAAPVQSESSSGRLSVWRPFHSQASAEGFARRLSTQLGHPFTVFRVATAEYHVIFDYANSSERELLKRQIATVTGRLP